MRYKYWIHIFFNVPKIVILCHWRLVHISCPCVTSELVLIKLPPFYSSAYRDRLTMPKLLISAIGDEHFMPDDYWYFWDDLIGDKYLW